MSNTPVRCIGDIAFSNYSSLKAIHISKNVRRIGFDAIAYCKNLVQVTLDPHSELAEIGQGFLYQTGVISALVPPKVRSIGKYFAGFSKRRLCIGRYKYDSVG